jgi:hypothetical protein
MKDICSTVTSLCRLGLLAPTLSFVAKADGPKARLFAQYETTGNRVIDGAQICARRWTHNCTTRAKWARSRYYSF